MRFVLKLLGALALAIALGLGSAYYAVNVQTLSKTAVVNGPWSGNLAAGGTSADMYARAAIAVGGLLALNKSETIYFVADSDSAGEAFDARCTYRIEGRDPDARWWSITAYGKDRFLIDTPSQRYSIGKSNVVRTADGAFVIRVSTAQHVENWIAASPDGFILALRLYNPGPKVTDDPATTALPAIVKEACS